MKRISIFCVYFTLFLCVNCKAIPDESVDVEDGN